MTVPFLAFSFESNTRVNALAYKCTASYKYAASARIYLLIKWNFTKKIYPENLNCTHLSVRQDRVLYLFHSAEIPQWIWIVEWWEFHVLIDLQSVDWGNCEFQLLHRKPLTYDERYLSCELFEIDWWRWYNAQIRFKCDYTVIVGFVLQQSTQILIRRRCIVLLNVDADHKVFTVVQQALLL